MIEKRVFLLYNNIKAKLRLFETDHMTGECELFVFLTHTANAAPTFSDLATLVNKDPTIYDNIFILRWAVLAVVFSFFMI